MASPLERHDFLSRLVFVFQTIGSIFLKASHLTTIVKRFVFKEDECIVGKELVLTETFAAECEGLIYLNKSILSSEKKLFHEFHDLSLISGQPMATVLVSSLCRICNKTLSVKGKIQPIVIYSSYRGTYLGSRITKVCQKCKLYEHYGYWTCDGKKHFTEDTLQLDFLLSTEDTAFELALLRQHAHLLVLGAVPFSTFAASYNRRFGYRSGDSEALGEQPRVKRMKKDTANNLKQLLEMRLRLDRRRLEEAFLLLASLEIIHRHNLWEQFPTLPCDRNEIVELVTEQFCEAFLRKWGEHACEVPGCKTVLVLDGNMKNARQVCMVKDIGELHFAGMSGSIVVGCQNTPCKGSQYCGNHNKTAMVFRDDGVEDEILHAEEKDDTNKPGSLIVKVINELTTRQGIRYEVQWADGRKTWVKECNLPLKVQECLKQGKKCYQQEMVSLKEFGQRRTEYQELDDGANKGNAKQSGLVKSCGFAIESAEDITISDQTGKKRTLSCGTEKGKHQSKNHRTAAPPDDTNEAWQFAKKLATIGMSIQKYADSYNIQNDDSEKHLEDYANRKDTPIKQPRKKFCYDVQRPS